MTLSRRTFLFAGSGLMIGFIWRKEASAAVSEVNAFIRIGSDEAITFLVPESEMGQGILTAIPMILAEELDVDWTKIRSEHAPADLKKYGPRQSTGGSSSVRGNYQALRTAGASARQMLINAAAAEWKVQPGDCRTEKGFVVFNGKRLSYGKLAAKAAKLPAPEKPAIKTELGLIGKSMKRLDVPAKVKGQAIYGMDVKLPKMWVARVVRPPMFGGKVRSFDPAAAKKVSGVREVVQIPSGVAVLADHFWAAQKGSEALVVEWDAGPFANMDNAAMTAQLRELVKAPGAEARKVGDAAAILAKSAAGKKLEAVYQLPYLAHSTMEPLNCTADVKKDRCEIWAPTQSPGGAQSTGAQITGLPVEKVAVHTTYLGGGFGRKSNNDFVAEAVHLSKAVGRPVQVVWTREDDTRGGMYRPCAYNLLSGALDERGYPLAWIHKIAAASILHVFGPLKNDIDGTAVEGASNLPYSIANQLVTYARPDWPITTWFWRSVGASINAYVTESFLDELAALGGKDPLEVRLKLLDQHPRHRRVLEAAAKMADWGKAPPAGRARGIAVSESFGSIVAEVAEVSLSDKSASGVRVHRVSCAVDCGSVINPSTVVGQMESSIVYGLTAALYGEIHFQNGAPVEGNFDNYRMLRMDEMPAIETQIVTSGDPLGGIGEPGTPPIAPAVANALFALTKKPVRKLPIAPETVS